ncbi:hypothetical protein K502DRAFT_324278 [Neoconidiobolus thromboides FSU 785]|nr:hypothetical protein K502DRAFT_324278 [Neoconidiobolus thromboides FSU 785]
MEILPSNNTSKFQLHSKNKKSFGFNKEGLKIHMVNDEYYQLLNNEDKQVIYNIYIDYNVKVLQIMDQRNTLVGKMEMKFDNVWIITRQSQITSTLRFLNKALWSLQVYDDNIAQSYQINHDLKKGWLVKTFLNDGDYLAKLSTSFFHMLPNIKLKSSSQNLNYSFALTLFLVKIIERF